MKEVLNIQFEAKWYIIRFNFLKSFSRKDLQCNNHCKYFDHVIAKNQKDIEE